VHSFNVFITVDNGTYVLEGPVPGLRVLTTLGALRHLPFTPGRRFPTVGPEARRLTVLGVLTTLG
jgi:hypothetical protein